MNKLYIFFLFLLVSHLSSAAQAIGHAPIGVMADHTHKKGESMISLRLSYMKMKGNKLNGNDISEEDILNISNPLSNSPANLSIVPKDMSMRMLMIGGMYAPSDKLTIMAMAMFMEKKMNLDSYHGMSRNYLGSFSTSNEDLSDVSFSVLINLQELEKSRWHLEVGLNKSIGSEAKQALVLTPMNTQIHMLMPYGMQAGDKSLRYVVSLTNSYSYRDDILFGNQVRLVKAIDERIWSFGDKASYDSWFQYSINDNFSISTRLNINLQKKINGNNSSLVSPIQTANPENYGGNIANLGLGLNFLTKTTSNNPDRLAIELLTPIYQDKKGLQMKDKGELIFGYQKSF